MGGGPPPPCTVATVKGPTAGRVTVAGLEAVGGAGVELITKAAQPGPSVEDPVPVRSRAHAAKLSKISAGTPAWTKAEADARAEATSRAPAAAIAGRCSLAPSSTNARETGLLEPPHLPKEIIKIGNDDDAGTGHENAHSGSPAFPFQCDGANCLVKHAGAYGRRDPP